ncbi:MAG: lysophospholipid acyltransferase family protein [Elusimicrobia bacterium]|nr:lysophospholipid acyltransferase family protein [Elusimicrobiota bacterium]
MPFVRFLVPYLAYVFSSFIKLTTSLTIVHGEHRVGLRSIDRRFIYAFWHQRQAFFTVSHRGDNMSMLISRSVDGEMIAETIRRCCGVLSVRGSSTRGASDAVRGLIKALRSGYDIGITPDGPKGPKCEIKEGVMYLAQKLGVPILPITNAQSNRLVLKGSWDHFQVPMPFGRSVVVYGKPIEVGPLDDLVLKAAELKLSLDAITLEAEALVA